MFGAEKSDSTHHCFGNSYTKSGSLRLSQFSGCWLILSVCILMRVWLSLWKIVRSSAILLLPLITRSLVGFMCVFCRSLFVLLYFSFCTLCCVPFFDLRILTTPFVSSISSYIKNIFTCSCNISDDVKLVRKISRHLSKIFISRHVIVIYAFIICSTHVLYFLRNIFWDYNYWVETLILIGTEWSSVRIRK